MATNLLPHNQSPHPRRGEGADSKVAKRISESAPVAVEGLAISEELISQTDANLNSLSPLSEPAGLSTHKDMWEQDSGSLLSLEPNYSTEPCPNVPKTLLSQNDARFLSLDNYDTTLP